MPIIKSAKKRMRQNVVRRKRNFALRSQLKTYVKKFEGFIKDEKVKEAKELLPMVFSVIDTADKKNIIHKNNAARKKSKMARMLNGLEGETGSAKTTSGPTKKVEKKS